MQAISDKIRHYRKTFPSLLTYALETRVLWLSILLMASIVLFISLRIIGQAHEGAGWGGLIGAVAAEVLILPGFLQAYFMGAERRYRKCFGHSERFSFRFFATHFEKEKLTHIRSTFEHEGDLRELVKSLVEEWEWRRELKARGQEPMWQKAMGFFSLPSASNFAAYMTGLVAVIAGIVIASMDPELLFGSFEQFLKDAWDLIYWMWVNLIPIVVMSLLPGAIILSAVRYLWQLLLEWLDDKYLGQAGFYRFVSDVLDLHDRGERDLMRKTRGRMYWSIRLGMAPLGDVPRIWRRVQRARRMAERKSESALSPLASRVSRSRAQK